MVKKAAPPKEPDEDLAQLDDSEVLPGEDAGEAQPPTDDSDDAPGWDAEGEHATAISRMHRMVDDLEIDPGEMVFDVRDFLLEKIKSRPKPWSATSQAEQRDVAAACEHAAKELVRKIVEAVASNGSDPIRVLLTKVNAGGDDIVINGKVKFLDAEPTERDKAILSLHHALGKHVMLTRATVEDYTDKGRDAEVMPDQNDFGFEAGGDDD